MLRSSPAALSRRRFLAVSAGTVGTVGLMATTGCAVPALDNTPDPILDLVLAAQRDAREFTAADDSHGGYVDALHRIGEARRVHAERLEAVLERPRDPETVTPSAEPQAVVACPPVEEVRARLRADAAKATDVAVTAEGIRAELTGAVSAACTTAVEVLLT